MELHDRRGAELGMVALVLLHVVRRSRIPLTVGFLFGALVLGTVAWFSPRTYSATTLFQPQSAQDRPSGLAQVASRFGLGVETNGGQWGPPVYVELLQTRTILEPVLRDSFVVEQGEPRSALINLLGYVDDTPLSVEMALEDLRGALSVQEKTEISAVELGVVTRWPELSMDLVRSLIGELERFNSSKRSSQAAQEREFVQTRVGEAEERLRAAEDELLAFLQSNRDVSDSPELTFQRDRLGREVELREAIYSTLVNDLAQARIREIRDVPVLVVLEEPHVPAAPQSRGLVRSVVLGGGLGLVLVFAISLARHVMVSLGTDRGRSS